MPLKVKINVGSGIFPETGIPTQPKELRDFKGKREQKEDYKTYAEGVGKIEVSPLTFADMSYDAQGGFEMAFDFEREVSKTYRFMGMEVDEDFRAVIQIPAGKVIVGPMFSSSMASAFCKSKVPSEYMDTVFNRIVNSSQEDIRGIVTAMKSGVLYSASVSNPDGFSTAGAVLLLNLVPATKRASDYRSVILGLIHQKQQDALKTYGSTSSDASVKGYFMAYLLHYWETLIDAYNRAYSILATLDVWSTITKDVIGSDEYARRMDTCFSIHDSGYLVEDLNMISFSGISKFGGVTDMNIARIDCARDLSKMASVFTGESLNADFQMVDLLIGLADDSGLDNIYALSPAEIQALSVLDSLRYIDEDATLVRESYDMDDEDERAEYVKAVLRSYERNFREFKPNGIYDVTDAMADMVENIDAKPPLVDVDGEAVELDAYTTTELEKSVADFKKNLLKVLKLLNTSLKRVNEGF